MSEDTKLPPLEVTDSLRKFAESRLACGPTLVCPLRVVWDEYVKFCDEEDLPGVDVEYFAAWMTTFPDVEVRTGGQGVHRKCLNGIGFWPKEE